MSIILGCNYIPSTAGNAIEMWQAESFDRATIERELGWVRDCGLSTVRIFLHHLVWERDPGGMLNRLDEVLDLAADRGVRVMPVLFDSCFDPDPDIARAPEAGVLCSIWVQGPGRERLEDRASWPLLQSYVESIVGHLAMDDRVFAWDVWNEPPARPGQVFDIGDLGARESSRKCELTHELLSLAFGWARDAVPRQPLTSALWWSGGGIWSAAQLTDVERTQLERSDLVTFHSYETAEVFRAQAAALIAFGKPVVCTESLERGRGATLDALLPSASQHGVGLITWAFVDGRAQTRYPISSWTTPSSGGAWHHDLLRADGAPYEPREIALLRAYAR